MKEGRPKTNAAMQRCLGSSRPLSLCVRLERTCVSERSAVSTPGHLFRPTRDE